MGRINKALNRSNYKHSSGNFTNPRFGSRFQQSEFNDRSRQREEKKDLHIIEISSGLAESEMTLSLFMSFLKI
jgi:ribosomal protein L20